MATRESLIASNQWNMLEDRPFTQAERKFNDHIDQMFFDNVSTDIIKQAIINGVRDEPRD